MRRPMLGNPAIAGLTEMELLTTALPISLIEGPVVMTHPDLASEQILEIAGKRDAMFLQVDSLPVGGNASDCVTRSLLNH